MSVRYVHLETLGCICDSFETLKQEACIALINLRDFNVSLHPNNLAPNKYFSREFPIKLVPRASISSTDSEDGAHVPGSRYLFLPTGIEKEQWFLALTKSVTRVATSS